jgi:hypothetical protein
MKGLTNTSSQNKKKAAHLIQDLHQPIRNISTLHIAIKSRCSKTKEKNFSVIKQKEKRMKIFGKHD